MEGVPHSGDPKTECFHPVIDKLGLPEILGANIHEQIYRWPWLNKERAYVQLISKLLDVEFDTIWQRHKRTLVRRAIAWTLGGVAIAAALLCVRHMNQPFDVEVKLNEVSAHNESLPPLKDALVTIRLDNESKIDTLHSMDDNLVFNNIPHHYLNQTVSFSVVCPYFFETDTSLTLSPNVSINIQRNDSIFGKVLFHIYDPNTEMYVDNATIGLAGQETVSDANGCVSLYVPLEKQRSYYLVTSSVPLENDTLFMPCGKDDVLLAK